MEGIVIQLEKEALDESVSIESLLRKAYLVARKLKLSDFEEWINNEQNGYKREVPDYRMIHGEYRAWNPYRGWIPVILTPEMGKILSSIPMNQSISLLWEIYTSHENNIHFSLNAEVNDFPFDAYQRQKWDIEHIHSVTTDRAQNKKEREEWLEEAKPYIDSEVGMPEDLKAEIDNIYTKKLYEDESAPQYDEMYNKVIAFFSGESSVEEKPINEISNLTLLDQRTNRGYGNHIFPVKRNKILEKSGIESFIPLCTKNVFLKFYSKTVSQMYLWDKHDRQDYFDKMVQTIVDYLAEDIEDMKEEI